MDFSYGDIIEFMSVEYLVIENFGEYGTVREYNKEDQSYGDELENFLWNMIGETSIKVGAL